MKRTKNKKLLEFITSLVQQRNQIHSEYVVIRCERMNWDINRDRWAAFEISQIKRWVLETDRRCSCAWWNHQWWFSAAVYFCNSCRMNVFLVTHQYVYCVDCMSDVIWLLKIAFHFNKRIDPKENTKKRFKNWKFM